MNSAVGSVAKSLAHEAAYLNPCELIPLHPINYLVPDPLSPTPPLVASIVPIFHGLRARRSPSFSCGVGECSKKPGGGKHTRTRKTGLRIGDTKASISSAAGSMG